MSILIKNGTVYDGTGAPPQRTDVLIQETKIARLGSFRKDSVSTTIDATGAIVTPGFIEVGFNGEGPNGILNPASASPLLGKGVTTVIGGNDGVSFAPFSSKTGAAMREWGSALPNAHWSSVKEFLAILEKRELGVNWGTLVGGYTLRSACGADPGRDMTVHQIEAAKRLLSQSLLEGALGCSIDMSLPHSETMPLSECITLFKVIAEKKATGVFRPRVTDDNPIAPIEEAFVIARESNANIELRHPQSLFVTEEYEDALRLLDQEVESTNTHFDVCPFPVATLPLTAFLPHWFREGSLNAMTSALGEKHAKDRLIAHFRKITKQKGERMVIADVPPSLNFLRGTTLSSFAADRGIQLPRAILAFMHLTKLRARISYEGVRKSAFEHLLSHPRSLVSLHGHMTRKEEHPIRTLLEWAEKKKMPLEKMIYKLSGLPSEKYGIEKRGALKEGYYADLVILRDYRPETVFVNGTQAMEGGILKNASRGRVIRAPHP